MQGLDLVYTSVCSHSLMGIQFNDPINYKGGWTCMCPEREGNKIGEHIALFCHNAPIYSQNICLPPVHRTQNCSPGTPPILNST